MKGMIGPLTLSERQQKVLKFFERKRMKSQMKKFCYKCRKQVAEKRLRIKGRFVTKNQAFDILGISSAQLKNNEIIQKLLENHAASNYTQPMIQLNSLVESEGGQKQIKIRNFQALIDDNYTHNSYKLKELSQFAQPKPVNNSDNSYTDDELVQQVRLNLRISCTKDEGETPNNASN